MIRHWGKRIRRKQMGKARKARLEADSVILFEAIWNRTSSDNRRLAAAIGYTGANIGLLAEALACPSKSVAELGEEVKATVQADVISILEHINYQKRCLPGVNADGVDKIKAAEAAYTNCMRVISQKFYGCEPGNLIGDDESLLGSAVMDSETREESEK